MLSAPGSQTKNLFGAKSTESSSLSFANFNLTPASTAAQLSPVSTTSNIFGSASAKPAPEVFGNNNANTGSIFGGALTNNNSNQGIFGGASPTSNTMGAGSGKKKFVFFIYILQLNVLE